MCVTSMFFDLTIRSQCMRVLSSKKMKKSPLRRVKNYYRIAWNVKFLNVARRKFFLTSVIGVPVFGYVFI